MSRSSTVSAQWHIQGNESRHIAPQGAEVYLLPKQTVTSTRREIVMRRPKVWPSV